MRVLRNSLLLSKPYLNLDTPITAEQQNRDRIYILLSIINPHFHFKMEHTFSLLEAYILHAIIILNDDLSCVVISQISVDLIDLSDLL